MSAAKLRECHQGRNHGREDGSVGDAARAYLARPAIENHTNHSRRQ